MLILLIKKGINKRENKYMIVKIQGKLLTISLFADRVPLLNKSKKQANTYKGTNSFAAKSAIPHVYSSNNEF